MTAFVTDVPEPTEPPGRDPVPTTDTSLTIDTVPFVIERARAGVKRQHSPSATYTFTHQELSDLLFVWDRKDKVLTTQGRMLNGRSVAVDELTNAVVERDRLIEIQRTALDETQAELEQLRQDTAQLRAERAARDEHRVADDRGIAFDGLRALSRWIDEHPGNAERDPEARSWGRLAKLQEEAGEVVAAFIGCTGQNPRKGITHTRDDVIKELLDVAITALGAVEHFTDHTGPSSLQLLDDAIERVAGRAGVLG